MNVSRYLAATALLVAVPRVAGAQTLPSPPPPLSASSEDRSETSRWYGWQTLTADGVSLALVVTGGLAAKYTGADVHRGLIYGGAAGFVLGAPAVHLVHDEPWRAAGSLAMRVGLPGGGAALGMSAADCSYGSESCGLSGALAGFVLGTLTAIAVDAFALAYETPREPPRRDPSGMTFSLAPTFAPQTKHAGLVASGTF